MEDEEYFMGMGDGCPTHGEDHMHVCPMCNEEFCARCFPGSTLCPECYQEKLSDGEDVEDFADVENLDQLLGDNKEIDFLVDEAEEEIRINGMDDEEDEEGDEGEEPR